jgi:hypothetical protein
MVLPDISHTYKDVCGLAQAKGLPSLIYHEPVLEVRFMRGAAGTTRILTIGDLNELRKRQASQLKHGIQPRPGHVGQPVDTFRKSRYSDNQIHEEDEHNRDGSFAQFCRLR